MFCRSCGNCFPTDFFTASAYNNQLSRVTLCRFAGNKASLRAVSVLFGMAESTLHDIIDRVANFFDCISTRVIHFPATKEEKVLSSIRFEQVMAFVINSQSSQTCACVFCRECHVKSRSLSLSFHTHTSCKVRHLTSPYSSLQAFPECWGASTVLT